MTGMPHKLRQLEGADDSAELEMVKMSFPAMKARGAKWLVAAAEHLANNPRIIVNGFFSSGVTQALNGDSIDNLLSTSDSSASEMDSEDEISEYEDDI